MKNLNLNDYRVNELTSEEMQNIIGGNWWSDFKKGFEDGFTWFFDKLVELATALT